MDQFGNTRKTSEPFASSAAPIFSGLQNDNQGSAGKIPRRPSTEFGI